MRWLIDAQLPPALARLLTSLGHQADHVEDVGLRDADDSAIWSHALNTGAVFVTKDEDFATRSYASRTAPVIIWLRIGNCSKKALLTWFEPLLPQVLARLQSGDKLIEIV